MQHNEILTYLLSAANAVSNEEIANQYVKSCWNYRLGEFAADLLSNITLLRTDLGSVLAGAV